MYPLQPAEKKRHFKIDRFFLSEQLSLRFIAKSSIIYFGSTQHFTVFEFGAPFLLEPFDLRRQDKWYVVLHYEIWHFLFDNLDVFEKMSGLDYARNDSTTA